jgi:hypothetical protein
MKALAITIVVASLLYSPALAGTHPKADLDFGWPKVGAQRQTLPPNLMKSENCDETPGAEDCEYHSASNVYYLVYGKVITRKRILIPATEKLPFGIEPDDNLRIVRAKVEKFTGRKLRIGTNEEGTYLYAGETVRGVSKELAIVFRNGRLTSIEVDTGEGD